MKIKSSSKKLSKSWLWILLIALPFISMAQHSVSFKNASELEILQTLAQELDLKLNYKHSILSNDLHNFSCSGNIAHILSVVDQNLGLSFLILEKNIYAVNTRSIDTPISAPSIEFIVIDDSGITLPYCNVVLPYFDKVLQTDQNGKCIIEGFYSENEKVEISYIGYQSYYTDIKNLRAKKKVLMKTASHVLGEIVITEFLSTIQSNNLENKVNLNGVDIAGVSDQDLLQKAQLLPGIHTTSESLNDLQIRGGPPDQVSYKWNDIRLLQTSLFYGKVSGVNPFLVDDISITRNGSSADKSGQASGSISLEASDKIINTHSFKIFSDLLYGNLGWHIPLIKDKISAKIAFRKSHNYLFNSKVYRDYINQSLQFGQLTNDQFYIDFYDIRGQENIEQSFSFDDLSANINWQVHSNTKVKASFIKIANAFQYNYYDGLFSEETKSDQLSLSNIGWSINGTQKLSKRISINALYNGSKYSNHYLFLRDRTQENGEDRFKNNDVHQNQWKADILYKTAHFNITLGAQKENWNVEYIDTTRSADLGLSYTKSNRSTSEYSSFAKVQWTFIPRTIVETGVRYSDFELSLVDRKFIEPRLHISHILHPRLTVHAHYGKFHQNLNRRLFSTPLEVEKGVWYLSDERPESENFIWVVQNEQSSIGLKYLVRNWKFMADAYFKITNNMWTSAFDFSVEEDPFAFADLSIKGLELSSHYQNKNWKLLWTYEIADETMTILNYGDYEIKSPFTQRHKVSLMQSYIKGSWTLSSRWRYNSGRRYSKGAQFIIETEPELYYGLEYESILEEQVSAYHSLDLSVFYKWTFNKIKDQKLTVGLHIQNVYNRRNILKRQYFIDYTKTPFEMSYYDREGLGFTPNVSLRFDF